MVKGQANRTIYIYIYLYIYRLNPIK